MKSSKKHKLAMVARRGENNHKSKLTNKLARNLIADYKAGGISQRKLAKQYGISGTSVWQIINGVTYKEKQ